MKKTSARRPIRRIDLLRIAHEAAINHRSWGAADLKYMSEQREETRYE